MTNRTKWLIALLEGNFIALALVTIFGFARHGTLDSAGRRMFSTFFHLLIAWLMVAPFLGAYNMDNVGDWWQLWGPSLAMVLAGPMAALLRGLILNAPIIPIFVFVLGGFGAIGILVWRSLFVLVLSQWGQKWDEEWTK